MVDERRIEAPPVTTTTKPRENYGNFIRTRSDYDVFKDKQPNNKFDDV